MWGEDGSNARFYLIELMLDAVPVRVKQYL
jgi:hypothetical protein